MTIREETKEPEEEIVVNGTRQFPDAFFCPITKELMEDPVVDPLGDSYERSAITARDDSVAYYPNRALKTIINKALDMKENEGSLRGMLQSWDNSIRSGWKQMLEKSAFPSPDYRPLPDMFYCLITGDLIHQPVIDPEGNTYEKNAIETWIHANGSSPLTRNPLSVSDLRPNNAIHDLLDEERGRSEESLHPSIRRWRDSAPPAAISPSAPVEVPVGSGTTPAAGAEPATNPYPTTPAQLEAHRRRMNQQRQCTVLSLLFFLLIALIAVPYFGWIFIFSFIFVSCLISNRRRRT